MSKQQEALRLALEALRDYRRSDDDRVSVAMGILQEALAEQPAQQYCKLCGDSFSNFNLEGAVCGDCAHGIEKPVLAEQPAQPSKPWVELTDEDIQEVRESCGITHHAIKTIEAKLREKNA